MAKFTHRSRKDYLKRLEAETFELLIIGGGITGAGIALQAAASGIKTAVIDMQDFAEGTSSRSTKLVHGGIRYLKQFDVEVVAETVQERAVVQRIAPHIPKPDPMLLPIYEEPGASYSLFELQVAMDLYDSLANVKNSSYANQLLTAAEVLERQSNLQTENLIGGGAYLDFNNNDSRLVIENIKQAQADGAIAVNRLKAVGFNYEQERIASVQVEDQLTGKAFNIKTKLVVNATGPWVDTIRTLDTLVDAQPMMRPTKGVHLVVDTGKLSVTQPVYFDSGENDQRMVFVLPRKGKTYFGTTDTDYDQDFAHPTVTQADVDYLLRVVNRRFPETNLTLLDIESSWAGLRPLIANHASDYNGGTKKTISDESFEQLVTLFDQYREEKASRIEVEEGLKSAMEQAGESGESPSSVSRGSDLFVDDSQLITIAGGKITDYRKMAEGVMQLVIQQLNAEQGTSYELIDSANYAVSGGHFKVTDYDQVMEKLTNQAVKHELAREDAKQLAFLYGTNLPKVLEQTETAKTYAKRYDYPLATALSLLYALDYEMVYSAVDFFLRRTDTMLFNIKQIESLSESVLSTMQDYLQMDEETVAKLRNDLTKTVDEHRLAYLK